MSRCAAAAAGSVWLPFVGLVLAGCGGGGHHAATPPAAEVRSFSLVSSPTGSLAWVEGRRYRLTLSAPSRQVALLRGRPFHATAEEDLRAWVGEWDRVAGDPPNAAIAIGADGSGASADVMIAQLSSPTLTDTGALAFDAEIVDAADRSRPLFPAATFGSTRVFVQREAAATATTATASAVPGGLFVISGATGSLQHDGRNTYRLTMHHPAAAVGLEQGPLRKATTQPIARWINEWETRGFAQTPPNAVVTLSVNGKAGRTEWGLVQLSEPQLLGDGDVQFALHLLAQSGGGHLATSEFVDPQLVIDSAPLLSLTGCHTDADCQGSSTCAADGTCRLQACTTAIDCAAAEACDTGHCDAPVACAADADCDGARVCDGAFCRLKACSTTADCDGSESCREGVCQQGVGALPATVGGAGGFWGASWTAPKFTSTCDGPPYPPLQSFCQRLETAEQDRVLNLCSILSGGGNQYSYYGQFTFFGVDEQDPIVDPTRYVYPPEAFQDLLGSQFDIFDSAYMNYSSRLGPPLVTMSILTPYQGPLPAMPLDFITPSYTALQTNTPASFIADLSPFLLNQQFGGGGGFGCYIGTIDPNTQILSAPIIQFGGGFGFGLSESDGLDIGFGGGINLCEPSSVQACIENPVNFFGSGGGVNFAYAPPPGSENDDEDQDGDETGFNVAIVGQRSPLLGAELIYLSCGAGGGMGFQSVPAQATAAKIFQQTFGVGGGGYSFSVIQRVPAGTDVSDLNVLRGVDRAQRSRWLGQLVEILGGRTHSGQAAAQQAAVGNSAAAERGLYGSGGKRYQGSLAGLGFVYEPYHFPLPDPAGASPDTVYIPGSTSPAQLFLASGGLAQSAADADLMHGDGIGRVLYALNANPTDVQYDAGVAPQTFDINDTVLQTLADQKTKVAIAIPLFIQHDSTGVSGQAPIVTANQELLDYAVSVARTHPNIDTILVGTAEHDVIKGFLPSCNGFNYTTPQLQVPCGQYASALTFEDYYQLLSYLMTKIGASSIAQPLTLGVDQSDAAWFETSSISNGGTGMMSLLQYWTLPSSTPNTGLTHFISDLSAANVTLEPLVHVDLVAQFANQPQPLATATAYLSTVLDQLDANRTTALVQTGWYGTDVAAFLSSDVVGRMQKSGYGLYVDEAFDQPWRGLPADLSGMPGTLCNHVYLVPPLDTDDPQGPPLPQQLPPQCSPDFGNVQPGAQPQPQCLCLTNSTDYPATFFPFLNDLSGPPASGTLTVPPRRAATYTKDGASSFYTQAVANKDGAYSLGVTWRQWPNSQNAHPPGDLVPQQGQPVPSLVCVGVSDAQNGAANANAGFTCDQVWFQSFTPTVDSDSCVTLQWTAKGTGYDKTTGWELQTLEAPPPDIGKAQAVYAQAPIVVVAQEDQQVDKANQEVSAQYTYCPTAAVQNSSFPNGLSPGTYWFRVQPLSGIPSVDGIDIEFDLLTVTKGSTDWQTLGKFSVDYPIGTDPVIVSIVFMLPSGKSFTLQAPADNGVSDITLPGKPQGGGGSGPGGDADVTTTMTLNLVASGGATSTCSVALVITAGSDAGDQDGEAVLANGPIMAGHPEQACYLELQNDLKTVNGSSFQFPTLPPGH